MISISLKPIPFDMALSTRKFNMFLFIRLPAAWWCGVRLKELSDRHALASVKYRWINQNPFKSMYWAVQGMAAELATGAIVTQHIRNRNGKVSMLILNNKASFHKKARGRIWFQCKDGDALKATLDKVFESGEGQTIWMKAEGRDEAGDTVSEFHFEWTLKVKKQ